MTNMDTPDDKTARRESLRRQGLLNPSADAVSDEPFLSQDFFDAADIVQVRYEMLRSVRVGDRSATQAAVEFGVSRATSYQARANYEREGVVGLIPNKRGPRGPHKLKPDVLAFIVSEVEREPDATFEDIAVQLSERFAISIHPRTIERALAGKKKTANRRPG